MRFQSLALFPLLIDPRVILHKMSQYYSFLNYRVTSVLDKGRFLLGRTTIPVSHPALDTETHIHQKIARALGVDLGLARYTYTVFCDAEQGRAYHTPCLVVKDNQVSISWGDLIVSVEPVIYGAYRCTGVETGHGQAFFLRFALEGVAVKIPALINPEGLLGVTDAYICLQRAIARRELARYLKTIKHPHPRQMRELSPGTYAITDYYCKTNGQGKSVCFVTIPNFGTVRANGRLTGLLLESPVISKEHPASLEIMPAKHLSASEHPIIPIRLSLDVSKKNNGF